MIQESIPVVHNSTTKICSSCNVFCMLLEYFERMASGGTMSNLEYFFIPDSVSFCHYLIL